MSKDLIEPALPAGGGNGARVRKSVRRKPAPLFAATTVTAVSVVLGWPYLASANGPGPQGLTPVLESSVSMKGPIKVKVAEDARLIITRITVAPGGHTAWHYHPGPHFVSVRTGSAVVYEKDCSVRGRFPAGTGFYDAGTDVQKSKHIHTLRNPSKTDPAEVIVTDIRTDNLPPTVNVEPQPRSCF